MAWALLLLMAGLLTYSVIALDWQGVVFFTLMTVGSYFMLSHLRNLPKDEV